METKLLESIITILSLEQKKRFSNTAVIGGMDAYLKYILPRLREMMVDISLYEKFRSMRFESIKYNTLDTAGREYFLQGFMDFLKELKGLNLTLEKHTTNREGKQKLNVKNRSRGPINVVKYNLDSPVIGLPGVSSKTSERLAKLGIRNIRELLFLLPRKHLDYGNVKTISELIEGNEQTTIGTVWESRILGFGRNAGTEAVIGDSSGNIRAVWFNRPYLAKYFGVNQSIVISGKVTIFRGQKVFESPDWEIIEGQELIHTGRQVPVYPLTSGLYQRQLRKLIKLVIDSCLEDIIDFLPLNILKRTGMMNLKDAVLQSHYPDDFELKNRSRERLAFDELLLLQLGIMSRKRDWKTSQPAKSFRVDSQFIESFKDSLPFSLTSAQSRVLQEICSDLSQQRAMSRLLQGEVGSGKTILAISAALLACQNSFQTAFMAPTEILVEQHFNTIKKILSGVSKCVQESDNFACFLTPSNQEINISMLIGSLKETEKKDKRQEISQGKIDILVGTHTIIQEGINFSNLGLVIIDEQQRFGVEQRAALCQKGFNPHLLVMTATPIPRTLALTLFGDLDISTIDELPPGRIKIKTSYLDPQLRERAYSFIKKEVRKGRQAFIICPLIDESEIIESKAAIAEYQFLTSGPFADFQLGLLHGRMSSEDKDKIMREFRDGKFQILVSTPVIEVGIDVPNATVMLIEGAERFGLSQLHQFRGRVGRGSFQSYCILLSQNPSLEARQRLSIMETIHNGFDLAEMDLKMRGPGEFFGTRQSGLPDFKSGLITDTRILETARREAQDLLHRDPELKSSENSMLGKELARRWGTANA